MEPVAPDRLRAANAAAAAYYAARLPHAPAAVRYLRRQGIEGAIGSWWQPGYAPKHWTALIDNLTRRGFTVAELIAAGLAHRAYNGRAVDYFRHRVVFPIHDMACDVVGFTGRDLSGRPAAPKYLNTPTTAVYQKSAALFGLGRQLALRDPDDIRAVRVVVVEGPTDAIAVHRMLHEGRPELVIPVALCGTMLTPEHLALLGEWLPEHPPLSVVLDGDAAGRQAFERWVPLLRTWPGIVEAAALPDQADPASLLAGHGPAAASRIMLGRLRPLPVARLEHILDRLDPATLDLREPETRVRVWRAITPCFRDAPDLGEELGARASVRLRLPLHEVMAGVVREIAA
ncbi:toprim domain-containing protein [Hamadaea tsunoensis]|uniref:toprim domain-containing protein n=1 Tax=Hamadaea tsunoensis TaxID=53368 RepID=UPI00041586DD|nr:toprim domain-containing protein [Hamadaea tsunoensis]